MKSSKIALRFLILFCFIFPFTKAVTETYEIELKSDDKGKTEKISEEDVSKLIYVKGNIDEDKKYLLISIISDKLEPSISVTKKLDFELYKDESDFTLISKEKKLVLSSSYFDKDINGFYMRIEWDGKFIDLSLKFEYLDEIALNVGEELSVFAGNYNIKNFIINIGGDVDDKIPNLKLGSTFGNIGFILSGGDDKQLAMSVNGKKAKQMINNALGYWILNEFDKYSIVINATQNVKFHFKTQIFYDDELGVRDINEYQNNQLFFVRNNKEECFNLETSNDNNRNLIFKYLSDELNKNYTYKYILFLLKYKNLKNQKN